MDPNDEMCVDYRFLPTYSFDPRVAKAFEDASPEKRAVLNRIEHLYHITDSMEFAKEAMYAQNTIAATGFEFSPIGEEEILRDEKGTIGYIEGVATQMVMGKEEAKRVLFP